MNKSRGFTIVELLVVIVVIGILAAITIVSFTGISQKATATSLQSDLTGAKTKLQMYQVGYGSYPTAIVETPSGSGNYCPSPDLSSGKYCFKSSPGNTFSTASYTGTTTTFILDSTNTASTTSQHITESSAAIVGVYTDPNWLTIGTQTWAKANLNVGTMVTGATTQASGNGIEKYCYDNLESNCTTYGGLYQWNEAMQYVTTNGAQGICPAGLHIPTDAEWTTLENYLGPATAGTQLKPGGSSGLNIPIAGGRNAVGSFYYMLSNAYLWSSSEFEGASALYRNLNSGQALVWRNVNDKVFGHSVRCMKD